MKKMYAKNPAELAVITNPSVTTPTKKTTIMAEKTSTQIKKVLVPAGATILGQAAATQITNITLQRVVPNLSSTLKKLTATGLPIGLAVLTIGIFGKKNKEVAGYAAVGMASAGVLALVRNAVPFADMIPLAGSGARMIAEGTGNIGLNGSSALDHIPYALNDVKQLADSAYLHKEETVNSAAPAQVQMV